MRSLLLLVLLVVAYAATPQRMDGATFPYQVRQGEDTLLAAPWIQERLRTWSPATRAAVCITSYATWPHFYFLRHTAPGPCEGNTPILVQGPCPERIAPDARPDFVIVQCGLDQFRIYHRLYPAKGTRAE